MARAADIHAQLRNGASFEELAKRYSEDASAASGGVLGSFKKGEMLEEFEEQVAKLKPGEYSEPFRTRVGVHIVRLDEAVGESKQSLETLAGDIRERLYNEALEERYNRWLREDLRQHHSVEIRP
jgi:peptidyl-prolyl cis-trans isomerase SurA